MATQAFLGKGTQLQGDFGSGLTTIGEVRSVSGPSLTGAQVDVTNMDSSGRYKEFIPGLVDPGTLEFEINYNPNYPTHAAILNDLASVTTASVTRNFKLSFAQLPVAKGFTFSGFILSAPFTIPVDSQVTQNVSIQISGTITPF